jgi:hypothetical protein
MGEASGLRIAFQAVPATNHFASRIRHAGDPPAESGRMPELQLPRQKRNRKVSFPAVYRTD